MHFCTLETALKAALQHMTDRSSDLHYLVVDPPTRLFAVWSENDYIPTSVSNPSHHTQITILLERDEVTTALQTVEMDLLATALLEHATHIYNAINRVTLLDILTAYTPEPAPAEPPEEPQEVEP